MTPLHPMVRAQSWAGGGEITRGASDWIDRLYDPSRSAFRFSPESAPCLIGSSCAVLAAESLGTLGGWPPERRRAVALEICRFQRPDGWFEDPLLVRGGGSRLDANYLRGHATFLAAMSLDALGERPAFALEFLDRWRDDAAVNEWIDKLDWTNPWRESNWVEWIGYWLLRDAGITAAHVPLPLARWPRGFAGLVAWLKDHQDPATGMWGAPPRTEPQRTLHLVAGAYHHYVFFYATGTPVPYQEAIVDRTLGLQQADGLFLPGTVGGGPCEDLDAVDILANMHRLSDYRRADIEDALQRAIVALGRNLRPDGAFVHGYDAAAIRGSAEWLRQAISPKPSRLRSRAGALRRAVFASQRGGRMGYAGSQALPFHRSGGDMFSQWFRPLAVALAATVLGPDRSPVWWEFGFRDRVTQGWWPGDRWLNQKESANP
jgi:hypothetical protein